MKLVKKIDIHAHATRVRSVPLPNGEHFVTYQELLEMHEKIGVEKAVLLPMIAPDCTFAQNTNEEIYELVQQHPDRFAFHCHIDPRMGDNNGNTDFMPYLTHYKALGAKGVGELIANIPFDDPRVLALFKACEACDMSVTFHIGHDKNGEYGLIDEIGLHRLEKCLGMFPKLRFFGHSQRFWSCISGDVNETTFHGWPTGPVAPGGRVVELMRKYPNLYGDLSATSGYNAVARDPEFGYAFMEEFQDRLFFGLDLCQPMNMNQPPRYALAKFLDDAVTEGKISYDAYYKISRGNAEKHLGLPSLR